MISSKEKQCNMKQAQDGPLKIDAPSQVHLFSTNPIVKRPAPKNVYKGRLEITNRGKEFVAFKIMSKSRAKLCVRPSYGFIEKDEVMVLNVTAENVLKSNHKVNQGLSIVILATTCTVIDEVIPTDLRSFWNMVMHDGSHAFVEVLEINQFQFYNNNPRLIVTTGLDGEIEESSDESVSPSQNDENNNNFVEGSCSSNCWESQSSESSSSHFEQSDSEEPEIQEESEPSGHRSFQQTKVIRTVHKGRQTTRSIAKMTKLSDELVKSQKRSKNLNSFLLFLLLVTFLPILQKKLRYVALDLMVHA